MLVVGGKINPTNANGLAGKFVKGTQTTHGGGVYDGFFAVIQYAPHSAPHLTRLTSTHLNILSRSRFALLRT